MKFVQFSWNDMRTNVLYAPFDAIYNKYVPELGEGLRIQRPELYKKKDIAKWFAFEDRAKEEKLQHHQSNQMDIE